MVFLASVFRPTTPSDYHNIDAHTIVLTTAALTSAILDHIEDATPATRKSYIEVVRMLPLKCDFPVSHSLAIFAHLAYRAIPFPIKIAQRFFDFLNDPDPNIVDSSVEILLLFFVNGSTWAADLGKQTTDQLSQANFDLRSRVLLLGKSPLSSSRKPRPRSPH